MSSCVVKWCRRPKERSKKKTGITYHSFPKNPIRRSQWIAAVRLERREDDWLPSNASRVCSIHFEDEELYSSPTGYQMLNKTAVPICTMVRHTKISPLVQSCTKLQKQMIYSQEDFSVMAAETATSNESSKFQTVEILKDTDSVSIKEEQDHVDTENENEENLERYVIFENECEYDTFNSPIRQHLEQQLIKKTMLAEKRLKKIKMLQRKNKRLLKRNETLKDVIKTLKNKRIGNSAFHT